MSEAGKGLTAPSLCFQTCSSLLKNVRGMDEVEIKLHSSKVENGKIRYNREYRILSNIQNWLKWEEFKSENVRIEQLRKKRIVWTLEIFQTMIVGLLLILFRLLWIK